MYTRARIAIALLTAGLLAACSPSSHPPAGPAAPDAVRAAVVGDAAAALRSDGQFSLDELNSVPMETASAGLMSAEQAQRLAIAFARFNASQVYVELNRHAGRALDFQAMRPCGRTLLAHTVYGDLSSNATRYDRVRAGPKWFITLCDRAGPALQMIVAAAATDMGVDPATGRLVFPRFHGGEFEFVPVPRGRMPEMLSPEQAAVDAAERTGRRVEAVPVLMAAPYKEHPMNVTWKVRLANPAMLRRGGEAPAPFEAVYRPVFVKRTDEVHLVPVAEQPTETLVNTIAEPTGFGRPANAQPHPRITVRLAHRSDMPTKFVIAN